MREITLEDGVETLEPDAIVDCYSLDRVNIPESVTVIGEHAVGFLLREIHFQSLSAKESIPVLRLLTYTLKKARLPTDTLRITICILNITDALINRERLNYKGFYRRLR